MHNTGTRMAGEIGWTAVITVYFANKMQLVCEKSKYTIETLHGK